MHKDAWLESPATFSLGIAITRQQEWLWVYGGIHQSTW